jgi:hypothetical protein
MHSCGFEPGTSCYHRQKNGPTWIRKEVIDKKNGPTRIRTEDSHFKANKNCARLGIEPGTTGSSSQCLKTRPQFLEHKEALITPEAIKA